MHFACIAPHTMAQLPITCWHPRTLGVGMRVCGRNLVVSVEVIANDNNLCGECPIWDWEKEQLYWTDSVGLKFYCYDWQTRHRSLVVEGFQINGYALDYSGGFVASNNSGIWMWDGADQRELIADHVDNHKCSINDCIADPAGRPTIYLF